MPLNDDAINKLASTWENPLITVVPIVPSYRYPTQEQMLRFVKESPTLTRLGLTDWALAQCEHPFCTLVSVERLLFRRTPIEFNAPVENGIVFKRVKIAPETAVLGLILATAFYDAGNKIAPNVLIRKGVAQAIKATAIVLANKIQRYSKDSSVKE